MLKFTVDNQTFYPKTWTFPAGETGLQLDDHNGELDICWNLRNARSDILITWQYAGDHEVMQLGQLVEVIRNNTQQSVSLSLPYVPHARQDRHTSELYPHALRVMCDMLKLMNFRSITVVDPHSDVIEALLPNVRIYPQCDAFLQAFHNTFGRNGDNRIVTKAMTDMQWSAVVAPDAGAAKKALVIAKQLNLPLIVANKHRDLDGNIDGYDIGRLGDHRTFLVVDDICDGGRTFLELAAAVKAVTPEALLDLYVTHGIFSRGREILEAEYRHVFTYNAMDKKA